MSSKPAPAARFSLRRWSQRKLEAARTEVQHSSRTPLPPVDVVATGQAPAGTAQDAIQPAASTSVSTPSANVDLPAIESLTIDSDFAPFFKPQVDESIKRAALKQLFRDPRFNVMDGLDTYIDDYTQPDPIPSAMLEDLMQRRVFFSPSAAEKDPGERIIDEPAGDRGASPAEAIAPPVVPVGLAASVAPIAQVAPIASGLPAAPAGSAVVAPDAAASEPETSAHAKADKP
jgi:Protein of unknown function (DUF3306)